MPYPADYWRFDQVHREQKEWILAMVRGMELSVVAAALRSHSERLFPHLMPQNEKAPHDLTPHIPTTMPMLALIPSLFRGLLPARGVGSAATDRVPLRQPSL